MKSFALCYLLFLPLLLHAEDTELSRRAYAKAQIAQMRGDEKEASAQYEIARTSHPTSVELTRICANYRLKANDMRGASTLYRELAAALPDSLEAQLAYADFLTEASDGDDFALSLAVKTLEAAKKKFATSDVVWEKLFRIHQQRGHQESSQNLLAEYVKMPSADPAIAERMAKIISKTTQDREAEKIAQLYLQRFDAAPDDPALARAASDHFRNHDNPEKAVEILARHGVANPSSLDLRIRLGILYLEKNNHDLGEKELLAVLAIDPEKHVAHQALAKLYEKLGKMSQARHHRSELLRIRGGDEEEYITMAREWIDAKDFSKALPLLEKSRLEYPKSVELAWLHAIAAQTDPQQRVKAVALFREAEKIKPEQPCENPHYLRAAAQAYWQAGEKADAEKNLRRAISLYPRDDKTHAPAALRELASWWQEQGKNEFEAQALRDRASALEK
jgi:predicted Zn-dependent protease